MAFGGMMPVKGRVQDLIKDVVAGGHQTNRKDSYRNPKRKSGVQHGPIHACCHHNSRNDEDVLDPMIHPRDPQVSRERWFGSRRCRRLELSGSWLKGFPSHDQLPPLASSRPCWSSL